MQTVTLNYKPVGQKHSIYLKGLGLLSVLFKSNLALLLLVRYFC